MGPVFVVVLSPVLDDDFGLGQGFKDLPVQKFAPELAIEALNEAVLPWAPRFDEERLYSQALKPLLDEAAHKLRTVVGTDIVRWSPSDKRLPQPFLYVSANHPSRYVDADRFTRVLIDHVQKLDALAIDRAIKDEVVCPHVVGTLSPSPLTIVC